MKDAQAIFRFLLDAAADAQRTALVTITDVIGSSPRARGTHMAIAEDGTSLGSFSGGCVEAAVVGEALRVIASGKAERVRFGAGSPFIDIKLPCGGGIDLLILPQPTEGAIRAAWDKLSAREPVALRMGLDGSLAAEATADTVASGWDGDAFVGRHAPDLRLMVVGHGAEVAALVRMATAYGMSVEVLSPDEMIVDQSKTLGAVAHLLKTPARSPLLRTDRDTAVVFLFHDHDWETELLMQALSQDTLYIGAMGSRQTQARRIASLIDRGVTVADAGRVVGPIGLIPATRDPETLALAVLAQIVERAGTNGC